MVGCRTVGMGPMPWTINSEIYPLWARSTGVATATCVNWTANLAISLTFLSLTQLITRHSELNFHERDFRHYAHFINSVCIL